MRTVLVLMDSLNRSMLEVYNKDTWVKTPNISSFAEDSLVFDNHFLGSAPCMPARRDIFTGRLNFLERCWGAIEPFDITLPQKLRENDIFTHIITDHTHYFEIGGENYCQQFNTWEVIRGQEHDAWISRVKQPKLPEKYYGQVSAQYELNRTTFIDEEDYPSPKTFKTACKWVEDNKGADDFFLMVESFDPHEPFDCPQEYLDMYDDDYDGPRYEWSGYHEVTEPIEATEHLRKQYAGTLSMNDKYFGKFIDTLKENDMYKDTLIIFTTDHGHLLGEHGWTGKYFMHVYNELSHLPLIIHLPGSRQSGKRVNSLTQNIDIMPTLLDLYNIKTPKCVRGHSLAEMFENTDLRVRDAAIFGWFGMAVNVTDGKYTYYRAPASIKNKPCNNYCAIPTTLWTYMGLDKADEIEMGRYLKHTNYPVYKIPASDDKNSVYNMSRIKNISKSLLFNIEDDYKQQRPLSDEDIANDMTDKMIYEMKYADSPKDQFIRMGLMDKI